MKLAILMRLFRSLFLVTLVGLAFAVLPFDPVENYENSQITELSLSRGGYRVPKFFEIEFDGLAYNLTVDRYDYAKHHKLKPEAMDKIREVLFNYDVPSWNGFDKNDRFALDGEDFSLYITFSNGSRISAKGSNKFPKNYREVMRELEAILEDESNYQQN